jgi:NAD-dependent dihydropyrimidine dehydrogenase PreA subunit
MLTHFEEFTMANSGIAREKIPWYPAIDADLCIGDQDCLNFCKNDVLAFDENAFKAVVANPYNCVVGCDSCAQICPVEAIKFPDKEQLRSRLRKLRAEAQQPHQATGSPVGALPVK